MHRQLPAEPRRDPAPVVEHVVQQLGIAEIGWMSRYLERKPTRHVHRAEIQAHYGYRDFSEPP
nr:DUF4158 domain-containing protein [Thiocapsa sp. KS1]